MTEKVTANPSGGGESFAVDVDGDDVNWPYAKLAIGGLGVQTPVDGGNPVPVTGNIQKTKSPLTASIPTSATSGTSSAQIVAANASRKGLVIINASSNTLSIGIGATAVLNSGITLTPWGSFVMDDYTYSTAAINAIASAVSTGVAIQEYT